MSAQINNESGKAISIYQEQKFVRKNYRYQAGKSKQLSIQLLRDVLKDKAALAQQQHAQKCLDFIEQLCPWFPKHGTLNMGTWKEIGVKFQQHFYKYGPERVSMDTLHFWALIQESLGLCPEQQEVLPPEPVRSETEPSMLLEE